MKVIVDLEQALLDRIYTVRTHVHKNSDYAAFPEMRLPEFLTVLIEGSVLSYEEDVFGFCLEVSSYDPS